MLPAAGAKRDLISYDVMPPAAASRFLCLLYSATGVVWSVDQVTVAAETRLDWGDLAARGGGRAARRG
jgi:hypothetical protein